MIVESGRFALARQQHGKAVGSLEIYTDELTQLKVLIMTGRSSQMSLPLGTNHSCEETVGHERSAHTKRGPEDRQVVE